MRVKNLWVLAIFLFALLLLPSVRAYSTNTDQEWNYGYFPDGGTTNGSEIIDCDKSYLINNNILDINASWNITVCLKKSIGLQKYAVIVANYSGLYRGLLLNHTRLYMRDFERTSFVNVTSLLNYTVNKGDVFVSTASYIGDDYRNFVVLDINTSRDHPSYPQSCWGVLKGFFVMADMGDLLSCPKTDPLCGKNATTWHTWWEYYLLWAGVGRTIAPSYCHPFDYFNILTDYGEYPSSAVDDGWIRPLYLSPVTLVGSAYLPTAIQPYRWWIVQKSSGTVYGRITPFATDRSFWLKPTFCTLGDFEGTYTKTFTKENSESLYWYYQQTGQDWELWVNYADPISLENTNSSILPPPTSNASQIAYFQQGVEANRRWCSITNTYYWVNYSATLSKVVELYPVDFQIRWLNTNTTKWDYPDDNFKVTIECPIKGYEDSYTFSSGDYYHTLYTPCYNDNIIIIEGSNYIPNYYMISDYDIDAISCPSKSYVSIDVLKPYDVTITIRDSITGEPIGGATIYLDASSEITNGNGEVVFNINPVESSSLIKKSYKSECVNEYIYDGVIKHFTITSTKSGYDPLITTEVFGAKAPPIIPYIVPIITKTIKMDKLATRVTIHLKTTDGVEFYPSPELTKIYAFDGNEGILFFDGWRTVNTSIGDVFPATFIFFDTRDAFNVTFSLIYVGKEYNQTYYVVNNNTYDFELYIDKSSGELPCVSNDDCPNSFCKGNYHIKRIGCTNNVCEYKTELCTLCDNKIGCYNYIPVEPTPCSDDNECINLSYCTSDQTSIQGMCGDEGLCLLKRNVCPNYCVWLSGLCHSYEECSKGKPISEWVINAIARDETEPEYIYTQWFRCGFDNVNTKSCYRGINISRYDYPQIGYVPAEWITETFGETGTPSRYSHFYDYIISCDEGCEMAVEYCKYGCSDIGECFEEPETWESQAGNWLNSIGMAIAVLFPTPIHRNIFSIVIMVIVGVGAGYITKQPVVGGLGMFAFCLMFLAIGWLPAWIIFIFIVLGAFAVYKMLWGE